MPTALTWAVGIPRRATSSIRGTAGPGLCRRLSRRHISGPAVPRIDDVERSYADGLAVGIFRSSYADGLAVGIDYFLFFLFTLTLVYFLNVLTFFNISTIPPPL